MSDKPAAFYPVFTWSEKRNTEPEFSNTNTVLNDPANADAGLPRTGTIDIDVKSALTYFY